ncbi:hypothetical protein [Lacihabitans soyangensis]|uniref:AP2/ERF domain-containing protein n=1 Tax=Lacihabitans soyangensis TaxID=869394 RepID=A0AAE3H7N9_9BACT|nr:hypothetical protein [Lacihabitans soyangensis]MCP9765695.1 hypothetical protein [Lacihabitans soyangensis]
MTISIKEGCELLIDKEDYEKIKKLKISTTENTPGKPICRVFLKEQRKYKYLHQLILGPKENHQTAFFKDGNRMNCQRNNLSYVSKGTFSHIKSQTKGHTSRFRGVALKYIAQIKHEKRTYYLGSFNSELEAAMAYNKKAEQLFSDMAVLNKF